MANSIMILGTSSNAGKSSLTTAFAFKLASNDIKVGTFKGMSVPNRIIAQPDGHYAHPEQLVQAIACGIDIDYDLFPITFFKDGEFRRCYVRGVLDSAKQIERDSPSEYREIVKKSLYCANDRYQSLVIEGCGSPVELNILDKEFVNLWVARQNRSPCVIISSAKSVGLFAAMHGTVSLIPESDRSLLLGYIINDFDGNIEQFSDGVEIITQLTGLPCLGIIPHYPCELEDDAVLDRLDSGKSHSKIERWTEHVFRHIQTSVLDQFR